MEELNEQLYSIVKKGWSDINNFIANAQTFSYDEIDKKYLSGISDVHEKLGIHAICRNMLIQGDKGSLFSDSETNYISLIEKYCKLQSKGLKIVS